MKLRGWRAGKFGGQQCHVPRVVEVSGDTVGKGLVCLTLYGDSERTRRIAFLMDQEDAAKIGAELLRAASEREVSNGS